MQLTDRRKMPRYNVSLNAVLTTPEGFCCPIKVIDISSSGLRFEVKSEELPQIISTDIQENNLTPISILLEIDTGDPAPEPKLKIQCGIVFLQRKNLDRSNVGCRFESFLEDASDRLGKYLLKLKSKPVAKIMPPK